MGYSTQQAGQSQAGLDPQTQQAALAAMAAEDEGWVQQNQLSAARQAEQEAGLNEMDRQSDDFVKARGAGQSSTRTQTEVLAGERGLEAVAKRLYGEQWRAGLVLLIQENKIKANQWGSPLIQEGQALQAPELNVSEETLAKLDRLGGQVIANNSKGLAARAELQRMQAEQQRMQAERAAAAQWDGGAGGGRGFVHSSADVNPYAQTTANANPTGGFAGRNQALTEAEQSLNQYYEGQRDGSFLGDLKARAGQLFGGTGYSMAKGANTLLSLGTDEEFRTQVGAALAKVVDKPSIVVEAAKREWNEFKEKPWEEQLTTGGKVLLETVASAGLGKVATTAARRGVDLMGTELKALSEAISPRLGGAAAKADLPELPPATQASSPLTAEARVGAGLSDELIQDIRNMPHGSRPDPKTYTAPEAIAEHLGHFDEGAARFMTEANLQKYGIGQRDGTAFVVPAAEANALEAAAAGSATKLEKALGLPDGLLQNNNLVRVDIPKPRELDLRMPSGNEAGANSQWIPGGRLPGGGREAVISVDRLQPGQYSTRVVAGTVGNVRRAADTVGIDASSLRGIGSPARGERTRLLNSSEIELVTNEWVSLGGNPKVLAFNRPGMATGYGQETGRVFINGDVFPTNSGSLHPTATLSVRETLAHEMGHMAHPTTKVRIGAWNDEFRASYWASKNVLGLDLAERRNLVIDAWQRAADVGHDVKMNPYIREMIYGF